MELTNQVANLQDEVKLLKGEIKSILKEIRTAVLSRDNPFSVGLDSVQTAADKRSAPTEEPSLSAVDLSPIAPALQIPPLASAPEPTPPPQPILIQGALPAAPPWAGSVPTPQPAPAPFTPAAAPTPLAPPSIQPEPEAPGAPHATPTKIPQGAAAAEALEDHEPEALEDEEKPSNEPIPIRAKQQDGQLQDEAPVRERPTWTLPAIAGLAVWAEDALVTLGPRRFQFVLELATFAELLTSDAREVLASLIDADTLSYEDERPLNVNECLVVLRQLEAIVHGEKVVKLPRRRGIRHRRIR